MIKLFIQNPIVCEELAHGSQKAKELLELAKQPLHGVERDYTFYACTEDIQLGFDLETALPKLNHEERFEIVHGRGHHSMITEVCARQMQECMKWMELHRMKY